MGPWKFWKLFCLGGGKWLTLVKEGFACETRGRGKLYRLTKKWTSFKTVVKEFLASVPSTDSFKPVASKKKKKKKKKKIHISQELAFLCGSLFIVMRHNSYVLFHLKLYMLWTKWAHQSANFQKINCCHKN